jgi:hypothetical protein
MAVMSLRPVFFGQAKGHPGKRQVAEQHPCGRSWDHVTKSKICREIEGRAEQADHEDQIGGVVQHQAEEGVDIAGGRPGVAFRVSASHPGTALA